MWLTSCLVFRPVMSEPFRRFSEGPEVDPGFGAGTNGIDRQGAFPKRVKKSG